MTVLLELKEKMKILYARYSFWIQPLLKFLLAMIVFTGINGMLGYMKILDNIFVLLITSLLCALMPLNTIVLIGGLMIVAHTFALGLEVGGITLVLILIMYLLFFRFSPREGLAFMLTPTAFSFGMPAVVPLGAGLLGGASSAVSVCLGTVLYYYLQVIRNVMEPLKEAAKQDIPANIQALIGGVLDEKQMFAMMAAGIVTALVVSFIRKLSVDYAWYLAIGAGGLSYIIVAAGGSIVLGADFPAGIALIGTLGSCLAALILEFFFFHVDYRKTEYLQYQDDTYVYYVKAVPKEVSGIRKGQQFEGQKKAAKTVRRPDRRDTDRENVDGVANDDIKRPDKSLEQKRTREQHPDQHGEIPKMRQQYGDSELKRQQGDFRLEEERRIAREHARAENAPLNNPYQQNNSEKTASQTPDIDLEAKLEESLRELERDNK